MAGLVHLPVGEINGQEALQGIVAVKPFVTDIPVVMVIGKRAIFQPPGEVDLAPDPAIGKTDRPDTVEQVLFVESFLPEPSGGIIVKGGPFLHRIVLIGLVRYNGFDLSLFFGMINCIGEVYALCNGIMDYQGGNQQEYQ